MRYDSLPSVLLLYYSFRFRLIVQATQLVDATNLECVEYLSWFSLQRHTKREVFDSSENAVHWKVSANWQRLYTEQWKVETLAKVVIDPWRVTILA
jgi:hypothetical protein